MEMSGRTLPGGTYGVCGDPNVGPTLWSDPDSLQQGQSGAGPRLHTYYTSVDDANPA